MILNPHIPVCLFHFLFSLNSHNTKMLCTICPSMAKVCNYQCRFFFCFIIIRLFFCFYFLLVMNDEHVYLASHKNSDRSCLHMYRLRNSFLVTLRKLILNVCLYYKVQCPKEILEKNKASENTVNISYLTCTIFSGN